MKSGYKGEQDLFVARLCFEVLIRNYKDNSGVTQVATILKAFPEHEQRPLMTFCTMLCESIGLKDFDFMKQMITMYQPQLKRDNLFIEYMDRIAKYYFDGTIKKVNPMQ